MLKLKNTHSIMMSIIAAASLVSVPATAQDFSEVQIESTKLTDNIYMLAGYGGNLGLSVGDDGVFLIDDQFAPLHEKIVAKIQEAAGGSVDLGARAFLLNTHFHDDHTGGNELLGKSGMTILSHENVRTRQESEQTVSFFNKTVSPMAPDGLPILTFTCDVVLYLNGEEIDIFHVDPAHTDGDAVVHFKTSNVIHSGDIVFIGTYPFVDLDNGGSIAGTIKAAARLIDLCDDKTKIIPGHGPLTDKAGLVAYHEMLMDTYADVKALVDKGLTLDQINEVNPTHKYDQTWSGFIKGTDFVGLLFRELSAK